MLGKLFKWIAGVLVSIILVVGGGILIINAKYNINVISVVISLDKISHNVELSVIAPKAPDNETYVQTKNDVNASVADLVQYNSETDKYSLNTELSGSMATDIKLKDAECCSLLRWAMENNADGMKANIAGKEVDLNEYEFTLEQIEFLQGEDGAINFNIVMSVSLTKIKDKMTSFPFNLIKNKVPNKLYVSSVVAVKKLEGVFSYSVSSVSLALNDMSGAEVNQAFALLNIFAKVGDVSELNLSLGQSFVHALIGNSETSGLAYSLRSAGAVDFAFETESEIIYFVIKK